jgi:hypothetical protein
VSFEVGSFYHVQHAEFKQIAPSGEDEVAYDLIFEHTCFQMHHPDRVAPMRILQRRLEDDGILLIYEKVLDHDAEAYKRREEEKDLAFKSRFFSQREIQAKRTDILSYMEKCQVYLDQLVEAISPVARYIIQIWRSGNFIGIVASNSGPNIGQFISLFPKPFVENAAYLEGLPLQLGEPLEDLPKFR